MIVQHDFDQYDHYEPDVWAEEGEDLFDLLAKFRGLAVKYLESTLSQKIVSSLWKAENNIIELCDRLYVMKENQDD